MIKYQNIFPQSLQRIIQRKTYRCAALFYNKKIDFYFLINIYLKIILNKVFIY